MTRPWAPLVRTRLPPLEMSGFRGAAVRLTDGACIGRRCRLLSGPGGHQNENRERPVYVLRILLCVCCERDPWPGQGWKRACRAPGWVVKTPQSLRQGRSGTSTQGEHPRGRRALPAPGVSSQAWRSAGCTGGPPRSPTEGCGSPATWTPGGGFCPGVRGGDHSSGFHRKPHRGSQNAVAAKLSRDKCCDWSVKSSVTSKSLFLDLYWLPRPFDFRRTPLCFLSRHL